MDQPELFPATPARRRQRRKRAESLIPQRVLFKEQNVHEQALAHDAAVRGTGRERELAFRASLEAFIDDYETFMPCGLSAALLDHLTRTDASGLSLCFNGPLRQALLADVSRWVGEAAPPAARARWQALVAHQQEAL